MISNIYRVAAALIVAFVLVTGGLIYWQVIRANSLMNNAANPRLVAAAKSANRGSILDRNGETLAESRELPDGTRQRVYTLPSLAQTIGYVSSKFGLTGLEQTFNDYLSGARATNTLETVRNDLLHELPAGDDITLTIDKKLQQAAAAALGDRRGAVVAMDPHTGAILAMVSAPSYDASRIDQEGDKLLADPNGPLINRATQGLYPPGSTYKTVTASAALDSGVVRPSDRFQCINGVVISGFVINCTNAPEGQTEWDFLHAYAYSINATFAQVAAEKLGSDRFLAYSRRFGMDEAISFDIDTAASRTSHSGGALDKVLLANSGFGQGQLQTTPLLMALVAATVANHGVEPQPYLVQDAREPGGAVVMQHSPADRGRVISDATAAEMNRFMVTAVNEGFGQAAGLLGLNVGGKTGTAETGTTDAADSWFIGFAPAGAPTIAVAVIVENGGPGSTVAGPIARQIFQAYAAR